MRTGALVLCAAAAAAAAAHGPLGWSVVALAFVAVLVAGLLASRRRVSVRSVVAVAVAMVSVALLAGVRAAAERRPVDAGVQPGVRIDAVVQLADDPTTSAAGVRVVVRHEGRRFLAQFPGALSPLVADLLAGDHVRVAGRLDTLDRAPLGWRRSRHLVGALRVDGATPGPAAPPWIRAANATRRTLQDGLAGLDERTASLALGLVIGDDRGQEDLDRFRFRASGLGHLLAVSGQNVALTIVAVGPALRRLPLRWRWLAGSAVVAAFVLVTRAEPSVLRAATMAVIALVAASSGRPLDGLRAVAATVLVLVLVDPMLVHSVGFQLSVAATIGLTLAGAPIAAGLRGPRWWREVLGASVAATLATLPVQVLTFGSVPVVGLIANVLAVPVAGIVVVAGPPAGLVAGLVHPSVGRVLVWPVGLLVEWIDRVATWCSRVPVGPVDGARAAAVLVGAALVVAALRLPTRRADRWADSGAGCRADSALRVVPGVAGAVLAVLAIVPAPLGAGVHRLAGGAVLQVDPGGERSLRLAAGADPLDVLEGLWMVGAHRIDRVEAPDGSAAATAVVEQFRPEGVTVGR